jgi:hypothetical protein
METGLAMEKFMSFEILFVAYFVLLKIRGQKQQKTNKMNADTLFEFSFYPREWRI